MFMRSAIGRLLAVALMAAVALVAGPAPAATPVQTKYANKVVEVVNTIRANNDQAKLKKNACLTRFAVKRAEYLAKAKDKALPHSNLATIQKACGVGWVGENVAYGALTAKQMVQMWMNSPLHKQNILLPQFRLTGGAVRKSGGVWWAAQVFGKK